MQWSSPDGPARRAVRGHHRLVRTSRRRRRQRGARDTPPAALGEDPSRSWRTSVRFRPPPRAIRASL